MPEAIVCIFAKPPVPGSAKQSLIPELGPERAAELAEAFLEDTVAMVRTVPWAECIIAATKIFARSYFKPEEVWLQSEGDLGERLEKVLRLALKRKPIVLAIGADSPGLPAAYLQAARDALNNADAVLGPTADGGFYLIGLKDCPVGVLEGIQWSHSTTLAATTHKLEQFGMRPCSSIPGLTFIAMKILNAFAACWPTILPPRPAPPNCSANRHRSEAFVSK